MKRDYLALAAALPPVPQEIARRYQLASDDWSRNEGQVAAAKLGAVGFGLTGLGASMIAASGAAPLAGAIAACSAPAMLVCLGKAIYADYLASNSHSEVVTLRSQHGDLQARPLHDPLVDVIKSICRKVFGQTTLTAFTDPRNANAAHQIATKFDLGGEPPARKSGVEAGKPKLTLIA